MRLMRRWTRKKPTAGARTPITAPTAKARRMNSESNMDVRGVVPDAGKLGRRPVEDDRPAHEHETLDVMLDGAELVRDVEDGHAEVDVEPREQLAERLLALGVDPGRGLVERQQPWLARKRLRDQRPLLLATREAAQLGIRAVAEADEL